MQNNKNILLIGGYNSLLGSKIYFYLGRKYKIFRTSRTRNIRLNLNNLQNIKKVLKKYKPNIIINCSAYTDVNGCEKNPIKAIKDNCLSNFNLCEVYDKLDIKQKHIIYISTDQIYNNKKNKNIEENIDLINTYAYTKFIGEVPYNNINYSTILRTNFFGKSLLKKRISYSDWILKNLKKKQNINIIKNTYFSPILIENLIKIIDTVINKNTYGCFNVGSANEITKYNFAKTLADIYKFDKKFIKIEKKNNSKFIKKPNKMGLNCNKLIKKLKINLPKIEDQVIHC